MREKEKPAPSIMRAEAAHAVEPGSPGMALDRKTIQDILFGEGLVAVHDAARPLISTLIIDNCFKTAGKLGNAVPCIPVLETVRAITEDANELVDRERLRIIQTPQVFQAALLHRAYLLPYQQNFTDDASLVEAIGENIHLVAGEPENIKITLPQDLEIAEILFRKRQVE